jgi:dTDP-4-amino-4,6-dideoxygalactose transaminase
MALTNDVQLAQRMALLRTHGITREPAEFTAQLAPPWHYEQHMLGFNYRMTDIQAALGVSQLMRIDGYIARRNALASRYHTALRDSPLQLPTVLPGNVSAYHLYVVQLQGEVDAARHQRVFERLRARGIGVNVHYMPVHLQPYYRALGFKPGQFPVSESHGQRAITLPLHAALTDSQQDSVVAAVRECT